MKIGSLKSKQEETDEIVGVLIMVMDAVAYNESGKVSKIVLFCAHLYSEEERTLCTKGLTERIYVWMPEDTIYL